MSSRDKPKEPQKSTLPKNNLTIFICSCCGFITSDSIESEVKSDLNKLTFEKLSCDADYSPIRVGKLQMLANFYQFEEYIFQLRPSKILDMSSARGHFALYVLDKFKNVKIDCIEPDTYMTSSYKNVQGINVFNKNYKFFKYSDTYDFIYSCHSLEHYREPIKNLKWIYNALSETGLFYVEVPNIDSVKNDFNIDEYFYDMHLQYFDNFSIVKILERVGFQVIKVIANSSSISVLAKKRLSENYNSEDLETTNFNNYLNNKNLIKHYSNNIQINRKKLIDSINEIKLFLLNSSGSKYSMIVGAGRILDFLFSYCNLPMDNNIILVDNYLTEATKEIFGRPLLKISDIETSDHVRSIENILILAKTSSKELKENLSIKFPNSNIKDITSFL